MKKFHVNDDGVVSECRADVRKCPLNSSVREHFSTPQEASKAYERVMEGQLIPDRKNITITSARRSENPNVHKEIAQNFPAEMLKSLAGNPHASSESLVIAHNRVKNENLNDKIRFDIEKHPNFPPELVSEETMEKLKFSYARANQIMRNPKITDEQALIALDNGYDVSEILKSENDLKPETIQELVESSSIMFRQHVGHPRYNLAERMYDPKNEPYLATIAESSSDEYAVAQLAVNPKMHRFIAENARAPYEVLELMSRVSKDSEIQTKLFFNPKSDEKMRDRARYYSREAEAITRLEAMESDSKSGFGQLVDSVSYTKTNNGKTMRYKLDPERVRELELTSDVDIIVKHWFKQNLINAQYDPETGYFTGDRY